MARRLMLVGLVGALMLPLAGARADEPRDPPPPRCERASCYDPLFTLQYPHTGSFITSSNVRVPVPFHFYDGSSIILVGPGDLSTMHSLTAGTSYQPVRTDDGAGVAGLIVLTWHDTDWGAYHEAFSVFAVNGDAVSIPATPGAMLASILDPENRIWLRNVILDAQLPLEVGVEYTHLPKEHELKQVSTSIAFPYGPVSFEFSESDGTPIVGASFQPDLGSAAETALAFGSVEAGRRLALDVAARGNLRARFVYPNVHDPDTIATAAGVGHTADPRDVLVASCCEEGSFWFNPATPFGSELAALDLRPAVVFTMRGLRLVVDIDL